jgi:hypothetical protein
MKPLAEKEDAPTPDQNRYSEADGVNGAMCHDTGSPQKPWKKKDDQGRTGTTQRDQKSPAVESSRLLLSNGHHRHGSPLAVSCRPSPLFASLRRFSLLAILE